MGNKSVGTFADVSNNNGVHPYQVRDYARNHDLLIVKVSEGTTFVDPDAARICQVAKEEGLIVAPYHFAHPDKGNDPRKEAAFFVETARKAGFRLERRRRLWFRRDELIGVLDYEIPSKGDDRAWIDAFKSEYRRLTYHGVTKWKGQNASATLGPILYGGSVIRENISSRPLRLFFWLAAYTSTPSSYWPVGIPKNLRLAWQYTASSNFNGLGRTDGSRFFGQVKELVRISL